MTEIFNMTKEKGWRDIDITDPDKYLAFTPKGTKTIYYVLIEDLEMIKTGHLPKDSDDFSGRGADYYKNTNGRYGGSAVASYFLFAPEIMEYLKNDEVFLKNCIEQKATAFLPQDVIDLFVF